MRTLRNLQTLSLNYARMRTFRLLAVAVATLLAVQVAAAKQFTLLKIHPQLTFDLPDDFVPAEIVGGYDFQSLSNPDGHISVQLLPGLRGPDGPMVPPQLTDESPTLTVGRRDVRWKMSEPDGKSREYSFLAAVQMRSLGLAFRNHTFGYVVLSGHAKSREVAQSLWQRFKRLNLPPEGERLPPPTATSHDGD